MENRALQTGDPIEIWLEDGNIDERSANDSVGVGERALYATDGAYDRDSAMRPFCGVQSIADPRHSQPCCALFPLCGNRAPMASPSRRPLVRDRGVFLAYDFEGEEGYLIYERPPVVFGERLREEIRFVPIDWIREIRLLQGV